MSSLNYNEVTHAAEYENCSLDPMFYRASRMPMHMEEALPAHLPNRKSRLRSRRERNAARFKTQPITFDEIKEVDEEPEENKEAMRAQLLEFSKSMEMLVRTPSYRSHKTAKTVTTAVASTEDAGARQPQEASSSTSAHTSSNSSLDACAVSATASRDRFRKRRKKRFHRSIEEVPDLERDTKTDE